MSQLTTEATSGASVARGEMYLGLTFLASFFSVLLAAAVTAREQPSSPSSLASRAEREEFLLKANIVSESRSTSGASRVTLDDGKRKHDAAVETSTSLDLSARDYRFNVAAYELDKALELGFVSPSVERMVNERPASVTWWVDDVVMREVDRRTKKIKPPDPESWDKQMQTVRVFDELMANAYRDISPDSYTSTLWDNLLITREWRIWLIDHTRTFGTSRQLKNPESLTRCDRALLGRLRQLNKQVLSQRLGKFLTSEQLEALEARRARIVTHFDEQIAKKGKGAVLYDLPLRR